MKSEISALKSEFEKDTTDSQVTRQILSYRFSSFVSPEMVLSWEPSCHAGQESYVIFTLLPACKFQFPSLILSFVADHLLWPLLPVCATSRELRRFSPTAFLPSPSLCLIHQHQRHSLSRNPLVTRKSVPLGNQILMADQLSSLLQTFSAPPHSSPSQLLCISSHNLETSSTWELQWSHIRYSEAPSARQTTNSTCS